ncbi:MAG TPA: diphosphomevalonate decarboxylase [Polyangiaceae bacterium]|nr:diphosphomevalonate decarboxylase [Polyangiaceae bacterium]
MSRAATARAHPNIALAKYWGKAPGAGNAPAVPSLSVTLAGLSTTTSVRFDPALGADALVLNGREAGGRELARASELLDRVRARAGLACPALVESQNDFPTASGLASSASGFAALALAAWHAAGLGEAPAEVSDLARRSSASAARSVYGGFVELPAGVAGRDEPLPARPLAPAGHLPLAVLVAVTAEGPKATGSTSGMNETERTSPYYEAWVRHAGALFREIREALLAGDLPRLGEAAEASALAMHASALAARPGLLYWTGATVEALARVRALRAAGVGVWATIDAGPHVKALCAPGDAERVASGLAGAPGVLRVLRASPGPGAGLVGAAGPAPAP